MRGRGTKKTSLEYNTRDIVIADHSVQQLWLASEQGANPHLVSAPKLVTEQQLSGLASQSQL